MLFVTGCVSEPNIEVDNSSTENANENRESDEKVSDIKVIIHEKTYTLALESNSTVDAFVSSLPQEFTMNELNGNEKFVYMDEAFPTNSYYPKRIEKGDVMLYGDNCLVLFYASFDTSFPYTKIGHIDDLDDLGKEKLMVQFEK